MEIAVFDDIARYRAFYKDVYGADPCFKDNKSSLLPLVCGRGTAFRQNCWQQMVAVQTQGKTLCQCVLIQHSAYAGVMQLAFFEALPKAQKAVQALVDYARQKAGERGCQTLVAGLEGHCNYSVGFLRSHYNQPPVFGQAYNPPYYHSYFGAPAWREVRFVSVWEDICKLNARLFAAARRFGGKNIHFEYGNFGAGFKATMDRYTKLSNEIFTDHRYCFTRQAAEDFELFAPLRPLLNGNNMIFACEGQRTVGFLFWYPDFNDFVKSGGAAGVGTFAAYRLLRRRPAALKVVEIGVLPQYRKSGLILQLFGELNRVGTTLYPQIKQVASSWILEENEDSRRMSQKILRNAYKEFSAYEADL